MEFSLLVSTNVLKSSHSGTPDSLPSSFIDSKRARMPVIMFKGLIFMTVFAIVLQDKAYVTHFLRCSFIVKSAKVKNEKRIGFNGTYTNKLIVKLTKNNNRHFVSVV